MIGESSEPKDGESKDHEDNEKKDSGSKPKKEPGPKKGDDESSTNDSDTGVEPDDDHINELASLWRNGDTTGVAEQFFGMDNVTAVKLVFAIGKKEALELARMVDDMQEERDSEGGESVILGSEEEELPLGAGIPGEAEPALAGGMDQAPEQDDTISQILGRSKRV